MHRFRSQFCRSVPGGGLLLRTPILSAQRLHALHSHHQCGRGSFPHTLSSVCCRRFGCAESALLPAGFSPVAQDGSTLQGRCAGFAPRSLSYCRERGLGCVAFSGRGTSPRCPGPVGSSGSRDGTCVSQLAGRFFTTEPPRKPPDTGRLCNDGLSAR